MRYFPEPHTHSKDKVKAESDFFLIIQHNPN